MATMIKNIGLLEACSKSRVCEHKVKLSVGCLECAAQYKKKLVESDSLRNKSSQIERKKEQIQIAFKNSGMLGVGLTRYFRNFKIYDDNQIPVVDKCKKYALNFKDAMRTGACLVFVGGLGAGKNHLAYAIANCVMNSGYKALFYTAFNIFLELNDTRLKGYAGPGQKAIMDKFTAPDLLIIDEIGVQSKTVFEENVIFNIINNRRNLWKPVILMSNCTSARIMDYIGPRCLDRLKEGSKKGECVLYFKWPSYRSMVVDDANLPTNERK